MTAVAVVFLGIAVTALAVSVLALTRNMSRQGRALRVLKDNQLALIDIVAELRDHPRTRR